MDILTVDFETYYDKSYSLSSITTEEYIRHELFETIGVAVKRNDEETQWFSGTKAQTKRWLEQWDWDNSVAVAHNAMFDMAILNWQFDIRPKRIADTLAMGRALNGMEVGVSLKALVEYYGIGEKGDEVIRALGKGRLDFTDDELERYAAYCVNDVQLTYELFKQMAAVYPVTELRLIDLTVRMFTEPVFNLDKEVLSTHLTEVKATKDKLMEKLNYDKADLMSNPKLAELLLSHGVIPPTKISPATGNATFAFAKNDEGFKALLEHENPQVQAIVAARLGVKSTLEETRTERFLSAAERGAFPIPLRYYGAHTGRWSGEDKVNLQNLPRKSALKKAVVAPEGYVVIDCDSSQIEARTLAWLAGQDDLVSAFAAGEDVYKLMASSIYSVPIEDVTDEQRFVGKTTILGCLAEGTLVLTDRGWVAIEEVTASDQLWDGEEWVCHQGLVQKGTKETLSLCGLWLTPDHKILCGTQWVEAQSVAQDEDTLSLALGTGAVSWLSPDTSRAYVGASAHSSSDATADSQNILSTETTSKISKALGVRYVAGEKDTVNGIGNTLLRYPMRSIERAYSIDYQPQSLGATTLKTRHTLTMEGEVSSCINSGAIAARNFSATLKPYLDGTTPSSIWTGQITTEDMNPATFGLSQEQIIMLTVERSASYRRNLMTYDIAYAGPRNRYTVATAAGPIIVHNCGYGMGAARFQLQLKGFNVELDLHDCDYIIKTYRAVYGKIPMLWASANRAISALMQTRTASLGEHDALQVDMFGIRLPNGMYIRYPNLREVDEGYVYDTKRGRSVMTNRIYGGKLVENACQALARIIIGEQMLRISKRYKVGMTVHDSVVPIVPEAEAAEARAYVEQCMRTAPKWAAGLPLNCESKIGASYGG